MKTLVPLSAVCVGVLSGAQKGPHSVTIAFIGVKVLPFTIALATYR
jgi:hypothetical protein